MSGSAITAGHRACRGSRKADPERPTAHLDDDLKERLHRLVDELPDSELPVAVRLLEGLRAGDTPSAVQSDTTAGGMESLRARLAAQGITLTPARPSPKHWAEPLPDLPGVDLNGAVLEEREEALWNTST